MKPLAAVIFIIVLPDVVGGPRQAGAQGPRAHQIQRRGRGIKERKTEGFAVAVTLTGFVPADVSLTPTWPPRHPAATGALTGVGEGAMEEHGTNGKMEKRWRRVM